MRTLILARHGEAESNDSGIVDSTPPGRRLTAAGREQARELAAVLARAEIDLGVATELVRTQETLALALAGRQVPVIVMPQLNEIRFGAFDGGPLSIYREWAWSEEADVRPPGDGESRAEVAARVADALEVLLARPEARILHVGHALPVRYIIDAADGRFPAARIEHVEHATVRRLDARAVEASAQTLRAWAEAPQFRDATSPEG